MNDEIPEDIAISLLRALIFCGGHITPEQRQRAWKWVEDHRGFVDEMGG